MAEGTVLKIKLGFSDFKLQLRAISKLADLLDTDVPWVGWSGEGNAIITSVFLDNPEIHFDSQEDLLHFMGKFLNDNPGMHVALGKNHKGEWVMSDVYEITKEDEDDD